MLLNDLKKFGSQCVVVAIDAKKRADGGGWNIYKNGGRGDIGMDVNEAISRMKGIDCNGRGTSCPDQLAKALEQAIQK